MLMIPSEMQRTGADRPQVPDNDRCRFEIKNLTFWYDGDEALANVTLDIPVRGIFVLFGPAQAGKSTLLRLLNRLNDLVEDTRMEGQILLEGEDIYAPGYDVIGLRRRVGMVFALPIPLPGTIRENLIYGPRLSGIRDSHELEQRVRESLERAALWDEVKDRLGDPGYGLVWRTATATLSCTGVGYAFRGDLAGQSHLWTGSSLYSQGRRITARVEGRLHYRDSAS